SAVGDLCRSYGIPFFLDAARFAENSWLVIAREAEYQRCSPQEVAKQSFALSDGCVASLKMDGVSSTGAFIGVRDEELVQRCEANLIATEGFHKCRAPAGQDLERLTRGLNHVLNPYYLRARAAEALHLADLVN